MMEKIKLGFAAFFGFAAVGIIWLSGVITFLVASLSAFKYFLATEAILATVGVFIGAGALTVLGCIVAFVICGGISTYLLK